MSDQYKLHSYIKLVACFVFITLGTLVFINFAAPPPKVNAFQAGRIMDDVVFYDKNTMSQASIQSFLNAKVPVCDTNHKKTSNPKDSGPPYICLKERKFSVTSKPNDSLCNGRSSSSNKKAAYIIYQAAQSCGVNPQVLLVLLQKEQSLVTDDWPWRIQFLRATGYGCPDTAPCDPQFEGFSNQVYEAAKAFKRYRANPNSYGYRAARNNNIFWHPSGGNFLSDSTRSSQPCGYSSVYITNQATAGLYIYTPYRPNKAALDVGWGTGNDCSSYGNRNFYNYFKSWFGSTLSSYRLIECSGTKYLIERGIKTKRVLTSNAITAWGLSSSTFNTGDRGCNYPTYSAVLDRVARSRNTGKVYMFDSERAFRLQSKSIATAWGYNYDSEIAQLNGETLHELQVIKTTPRLAKSANTHKVYLLNQGKIHHILGTPSNTDYLRLVRGYSEIPMALFTGEYLSDIKTTKGEGATLGAAFKASGEWYLFDHGKVRWVKPSYFPNRWEDLNAMTGPALHPDVPNVMNKSKGLGPGFKRDKYYFVGNNGNIAVSTSVQQAREWGVNTAPEITYLLRSKLLN